jgi:stress response protein YsnF
MTTFETQQLLGWIGRPAVDAKGNVLGTVDAIYEDDSGAGPEWFTIDRRDSGGSVAYVPVRGATSDGDRLRIPYTTSHIDRAPVAGADAHLDPDDVARLYQHYGMEWAFERLPAETDVNEVNDVDVDDDGATLTRSEEELRITTREREAGRAHLRKWVETEMVQVTVPVRREYARLVIEPATGEGSAQELDDHGPADDDVVLLREEEIVIEKRVVEKESVRLEVDTVVEERVVSDEVRKERIAVEGDVET